MALTSPPRGHTAAEAEARYIPGQKSPIDLPDDFGADDAETDGDGVISWMAAALAIVAVIAAIAIFGWPA